MVNIEIDGQKIQAKNGSMVIEVADEAGIRIPRFCYHKKLPIAANCRMCLVEVEKAAKPLPACATPVTEGMKVFTKSPKALAAQQGVMQFLLINHPLDCPICDQGGECELQDVSIGYGNDVSAYAETKRVVKYKNFGPLIASDMTRCIHCTRCVRFGEEIAGIKEFGSTGRGEHMEIGTYIQKAISSELSGNVIDLCPVGALTSKTFRYTARAWELQQKPSIAPHDCIGSNIYIHTRKQEVMRVIPRENEAINETWISDRDRFSYTGLNYADRLGTPKIKRNGSWVETDWQSALQFVVENINKIRDEKEASRIGLLSSPSATVEEMYLAQQVLRGIGSSNVDHRLRRIDFRGQEHSPEIPWLGTEIGSLETLDAALLIGSNVRKDPPIAGHRIRKAALNGAKIMFLNSIDYEFNFPVAEKIIVDPRKMCIELAAIAKCLLQKTNASQPQGFEKLVQNIEITQSHENIAENLLGKKEVSVILGLESITHPDYSILEQLAKLVSDLSQAKLGYLSHGANSVGAHMAGMVPHRLAGGKRDPNPGQDALQMTSSPLKAYFINAIEPEFDCVDPVTSMNSLSSADFVVALTYFESESILKSAHVLLPIAPFSETSGTFVNVEGRWQSFNPVVTPFQEARPAWKVWRVLGNLFDLPGFEYVTSEEVKNELLGLIPEKLENKLQWHCPHTLKTKSSGIVRLCDVPIYRIDSIVRRSSALQQTQDSPVQELRINRQLAGKLGIENSEQILVKQGSDHFTLPLVIDNRIPDGAIMIPPGEEVLKPGFESVDLEKIQ